VVVGLVLLFGVGLSGWVELLVPAWILLVSVVVLGAGFSTATTEID